MKVASRALTSAGLVPAEAVRDAEVLLGAVLGVGRAWLMAHGEQTLDAAQAEQFAARVARRAGREPVAYILGEREFWSLALEVTPDVLIPRPETELLVELTVARMQGIDAPRIADVGTGSGAIAVALAVELPAATLIATDLSPAALAVANRNLVRHDLADRVSLYEGDLLEPLSGLPPFDAIVSNPPYVSSTEYTRLEPDVRSWEPAPALLGGADGLDVIRRLVVQAPAHLVPSGWLLLEHGAEQGPACRALLDAAGYGGVGTACDHAGRDRVTFGQSPR